MNLLVANIINHEQFFINEIKRHPTSCEECDKSAIEYHQHIIDYLKHYEKLQELCEEQYQEIERLKETIHLLKDICDTKEIQDEITSKK